MGRIKFRVYIHRRQSFSTTRRRGTADAEIKRPLVGASPGLSKVHKVIKKMFEKKKKEKKGSLFLSLHVVGNNIASHAAPAYRASTHLVSAFPAHSTSFSPMLSNPLRWNVYLVMVNQNIYLW